ncbi:unnamed protein product [Cyclocybe aegerita]|uniref:Uncharacterized protein n=1 Tax=Cyclocybe aegerita TaxID=1973307 RepID=A0A8S0WZ97_CYCAE|nr:unnamed protein product [Cyclocybe aegerita]
MPSSTPVTSMPVTSSTLTESTLIGVTHHSPLVQQATELEGRLELAAGGALNLTLVQAAVRDAQILIAQLKDEVRKMGAEIANLLLSQDNPSHKAAINQLTREICQLASSFQFLYSPFVTKATFKDGMTNPLFLHDDPIRYVTDKNVELGIIAELFHWVSAKFHECMGAGSAFANVFGSAISSSRLLAFHQAISTSSLAILELLGCTKPGDSPKSCSLPPILYKDFNDGVAMGLFLNSILITIARVIIYGPRMGQSSTARLKSTSPFVRPGQVMSITPGAIAYTTILLWHLLSGDTEFTLTRVGSTSNINYVADFEMYKKLIIQARDGTRQPLDKAANSDDGTEDKIADALYRMELEGSDSSESGGSDSELDEEEGHQGSRLAMPMERASSSGPSRASSTLPLPVNPTSALDLGPGSPSFSSDLTEFDDNLPAPAPAKKKKTSRGKKTSEPAPAIDRTLQSEGKGKQRV